MPLFRLQGYESRKKHTVRTGCFLRWLVYLVCLLDQRYVPKWLIYSQNHAVRKLLRSRHNKSHAYNCKALVPLEKVRPRHAAREMASIGQIWRAQIDTKSWGKNALQSYVLWRFGGLSNVQNGHIINPPVKKPIIIITQEKRRKPWWFGSFL